MRLINNVTNLLGLIPKLNISMLRLVRTKRTDPKLLELMKIHYSHPKGFVGRNLCYAIYWDDTYHGHIVGGSATRFLPGRNEFLNIEIKDLNQVINNIFYHVFPVNDKYPTRNFTTFVLKNWMQLIKYDWKNKYGDNVIGFETLVELPRTGELYRRAGFHEVGTTIGYQCKRVAGTGTDNWSRKRVWNVIDLKPKLVLCKRI